VYFSFPPSNFPVACCKVMLCVCLVYVFGEFPRSLGGSFEKFSGLYSGRPCGRSLSFATFVRESVSLGLFTSSLR